MKRFLNSVLCMCIAVFCTHAQKKNVTSVLEVMDITTCLLYTSPSPRDCS